MKIEDAENKGAWPIDLDTQIGQLRTMIGDTNGTEYDPPVTGFREFKYFSDDELAVYVANSGGSLVRAQGMAYLQLGGVLGESQRARIAAKDLSVDLSKRGGSFIEAGKALLNAAKEADAAAAASDSFFALTGGWPS